jgi:HEAT repeat protein
MKVFFRKLFNIYAGEEKQAFFFAFLGFMWALAVTSGLKFADALFLLHVGAQNLPIVYGLTACLMVILATFLLKAFHSISTERIFISILTVGMCFYAFAYFCLDSHIGIESKWLWYALRIFGSLFFTILVTCFWTFVDQYYHLQDAKRLYSLFSSSIFLGIAMTGIIMRSGMVDFQNLIIFIIALLILTAFWVANISKRVQPVYDENVLETSGNQNEGTLKFLILSMIKSPFAMLLMASNFLIFLFMVVTEYSYMSAFDEHFDPNNVVIPGGEETAQLTLFLGQCIAGVSLINLIFGLFFYSRCVRYFGVNNLVLVTPIFLMITYTGWLIWGDILLFPVMGFFVVEGMIYIIDDNNFTLLLNAVPSKAKYRIRLIIESFFEPIGMLISSLLISFAPIDSRKLGLILATCALGVALLLRQRYLKAIYHNLLENAIHFQRTIQDWFFKLSPREQRNTERRLIAILQRGDEKSQLFAIEALLENGNDAILAKLLQIADKFYPSTKIIFIHLLAKSSYATDSQVFNHLHQWANDEHNHPLRGTILFYLAQHGLLHPDKMIQELESDDPTLKGAAILALKTSGAHLPAATVAANRTLAAQYLQQMLDSDNEEEVCIGIAVVGAEELAQDIEILLPFLKQPSLRITRSAASAIARVADDQCTRFASLLIAQLYSTSDTEIRQSCLQALGKMGDSRLVRPIISASIHFRPNERRLTETIIYQMGKRTVPTLLALTKDTTMHDRCRVLAGRTLGRIALPQLRANLYDIISIEIDRAYLYFYHQQTIQAAYPDLDLAMLQDGLLDSFHSVLDFIIQILGVAGEIENCELLSHSIRSSNPKVRSQVLETLEKTCEPAIYRALYPLIADIPKEERLQAYLNSGRTPLSLNDLLDNMSRSSMRADQIMAAALKYRLDIPNWRESLRRQMATNEEIFHHFAYELLET